MSSDNNYWTRTFGRPVSRRAMLRGAGVAGIGLAGAALIGCGDDDDDDGGAAGGGGTTGGGGGGGGGTTGGGGGGAAASDIRSGGTLKLSTLQDIDTWDVQTAVSFRTSSKTAFTSSMLTKYDIGDGAGGQAPGSVTGDLAETIEQVDETTFNFKLRQNAPWDERAPTNGRALDSEDVTVSWGRFIETSAYRKTLSNVNSDAAPVLSLEAIDDLTIQMKLARPDALVLQFMSWYLSGLWIDPKEAANGGFDPAVDVRGNGAWLLDDYQPAISFKWKRNPTWYGGKELPYIDRIEMPIIEDAAQNEAQFRAGNIHWGGVLAPSIPIVAKEVPGTEILQLPATLAGSTFGMNRIPESGFNDIRVRKALSMSLDRDTFIEVILDPDAFEDVGVKLNRFWNTPLGAGFGAFWLDPKGSNFGPGAANLQHNVAEAKKLLAAADYDSDNPFEFDLIFPGVRYGRDWPTRAETWQSMARDAGIKVNLVVLDYTTEWIPKPPEGVFRTFSDFEGPNVKSAVTYRPNGGRSTPGEWFNTFMQSVGANNEVGDHWPELDALITNARGVFDFEERVQKVHDIQRFMMENMVSIPTRPDVDIVSIKWAGLYGPGELNAWGGGAGSPNLYRETFPAFHLDDTLQS